MDESAAAQQPVVIVGGGWAGMAAAVELCDNGAPVVLIEAARQLGGRARSLRFGEHVVDNGQHIITGAYQSLLELLERIGVATENTFTRIPLTLHCLGGDRLSLHLRAPRLPAPLNLTGALLKARGLSLRDKLQALRFGRRLQLIDIAIDRDISVQALLHSEGQTPALIAKLWEPLCIATLNTPIGDASARIFLRVLRESFSRQRKHSDLLLPRVELGNLLPNPGNEYLERHGARVMLGQRVTAVHCASGRVRGVTVGNQTLPASHVVLATPHIVSRRLLSAEPLLEPLCTKLAALGNAPVITLYLQYPTSVQLPHSMTGLHGSVVQWVFDRSHCGAPGMVAVVISATGIHTQMDNDSLTSKVAAELAAAFRHWPAHQRSLVVREKRATFSSTTGIDAHRPDNRTAMPGLWLAGDYTCNGLPATLEGAVRSGLSCARAIIDSPIE
ncbi:MAG: hydroxysqualene dehydroxylase HpnE [Thiogranum sp.]|nr:hydroxysqualene dehydroxylase HpnE [Thiogranum sp.]